MFSSRSIPLLHVLAASAASFPFVAAQNQTEITTDQLYAKISPTAAPPGFNVEGGSVFGNFVNAFNDGQFFLVGAQSIVYEKPDSEPVQLSFLVWCSDLTFSDLSNSSLMGYAGRCVGKFLDGYAEMQASGGQLPYAFSEGEFDGTIGISAVFVEQLNIFEGQFHWNTDDLVYRYWDDGRNTMPRIAWEGHDEGDMSSNAATSSFSKFGDFTWISFEEVAQSFNTSADEFTPETFKKVYEDTWIKTHEKEAAEQNPNSLPELEIIEQMKNGTDASVETMSPDESGSEEDGGSVIDPNDPIEDASAGTGRELTSVGARFASAALRVFGF